MNQQQSEFIVRAIQQLRKVIGQCAENSASSSAILGRRSVGRHIVVVRIIAELDEGFSAPLNSHASGSGASQSGPGQSGLGQFGSGKFKDGKFNDDKFNGSQFVDAQVGTGQPGNGHLGASQSGRSSTIEPDYSKHTEHHNKSNRVNRWHKPIFDL